MTLFENEILFGFLACAVSAAAAIPYIRDILRGRTRPHAFTWLLWVLTMSIVAAAQISDDAGPGAWAMVVGAGLTFCIFLLSLKYGEKHITRADWVAFVAGLCAVPLWIVTQNPLWSVVLVTGIDTMAYVPTIRKSWWKPHEETLLTYAVSMLWQGLSILAMDNITLVTVLAPATFVTVNGLFIAYVFARRWRLTRRLH